MSADLVGIDLFPRPKTDTLADKVRRSAQARALVAFAKKVQDHADEDLHRDVKLVSEATGSGGFSKRVDGVRASLTDPQPKPRVTDSDEFGAWWVEQDLDHSIRFAVEVTDHGRAASAVGALNGDDPERHNYLTPADAVNVLLSCLAVRTEVILPENAVDSLTESGRCVATDDGLVDLTTGEPVPGVSCFRAKQVLSVTPDKASKKRNERIVADYFGVDPAALERGDA